MPMIKFFSTPNQALLWLQVRMDAVSMGTLGMVWACLGYIHVIPMFDGIEERKFHGLFYFVIPFVTLTSTVTSPSNRRKRPASLLRLWSGFHAQLPVSWRQLARADIWYAGLASTLVSMCYLAGVWIAEPFSIPPREGVLALLAVWVGLTGRTAADAALGTNSGPSAIVTSFVFLVVVFLMLPTGEVLTTASSPLLLFAIPFVALWCSYTTLQWAGPKVWRVEVEARSTPAIEDASAPTPCGELTFPDQRAAIQWFFIRRAATFATREPGWLAISLSLLFLYAGRLGLNWSFMVTPYLAGAAGALYLYCLRYLEGSRSAPLLPASLWSRSVIHLRFVAFGVCALLCVCVPAYVLEILVAPDLEGIKISTALLWLIWVTWSGLSFSPFLLLATFPFVFLGSVFNFPDAAVTLASVVLLAIVVGRDILERTVRVIDLALFLIPVVTCTTITCFELTTTSDLAPRWIIREVLGAVVVLGLLRYNVVTHRIPIRTAWRLAGAVAASIAGVVALLLQFGAPTPPDGIAGLFLGLGVMAPIFLPLLWIPHAIEWARQSGTKHPLEPVGNLRRELWEDLR